MRNLNNGKITFSRAEAYNKEILPLGHEIQLKF